MVPNSIKGLAARLGHKTGTRPREGARMGEKEGHGDATPARRTLKEQMISKHVVVPGHVSLYKRSHLKNPMWQARFKYHSYRPLKKSTGTDDLEDACDTAMDLHK